MEVRPTSATGDGAPGLPPGVGDGVDVGAVMLAILAESKKQTAIAERSERLLHRILLGDLDQLDSADVMAAIGVGRTKLDEMRQDGEVPMYQRAPGGPWYMARETLRAVVRKWAG